MKKHSKFMMIMDEIESSIERYKSEIEQTTDPVMRQKLISLLLALQAADGAMYEGLRDYDGDDSGWDWSQIIENRRGKTEQFLLGIAG